MLVNELTFSELKSIIDPVLRLEPMNDVISKISEPLLIEKPSREKISEQCNKQLIRYKEYELTTKVNNLSSLHPLTGLEIK